VRPIVTQLVKFEKAAPAMTYYFPDIINGIDVSAEQKRLKDFAFAPVEAAPEHAKASATPANQTGDLESMLAEGDHQIALKDAAAASATFQKVLEKYPDEPRARYGLAVASILSGDGERAQELFEQIVASWTSGIPGAPIPPGTPDPSILAWSHVYLGRIHDLQDERDEAVVEYRAALAVHGSPENARVAAQRGLDLPYTSRAPESDKPSHNP
jgi:tetratricopeptide (TPR) repeat protein